MLQSSAIHEAAYRLKIGVPLAFWLQRIRGAVAGGRRGLHPLLPSSVGAPRGGLNWYRNIDRNWELLAPFAGAKVMVPALYVSGDCDLVVKFPKMDQLIANLKTFVPNLTKTIMLPGCGHWTQQERADEVNAALIAFLREVN